MQEPFGAYSWCAVNDQPSDKALYSFTIRVPAPMVGVANGELVERHTTDRTTVTRWELDVPAASYLVTLAIGEGNVCYGPALMWHELRGRIGERAFWGFARAWPRAHRDGNASREDLIAFVERRTGRELSAFFDAWLLGRTSRPRS